MKQKSSAKYVGHLKLRGKSKVQTVQETAFILEHRKKEWWNIKMKIGRRCGKMQEMMSET